MASLNAGIGVTEHKFSNCVAEICRYRAYARAALSDFAKSVDPLRAVLGIEKCNYIVLVYVRARVCA